MSETENRKNSSYLSKNYLDNRVNLSIHPKNLQADGKSIGHIALTIDDPQKRSIEGIYAISVSMKHATIITRADKSDTDSQTIPQPVKNQKNRKSNWSGFTTRDNKLFLNFLPDKNTEDSELTISTPWGDIKERIKYAGSIKNSISESLESIIYAFIIAIIIRTFLFQAFFIPSQSMQNTLDIGDRIVVNKMIYKLREPKRQEVFVFRTFTPKERMLRFHLDDSLHFDPTRNLREPEYYNNAYDVVKAIMNKEFIDQFPEKLEIKNGALYANNLFLGFPENSENGKLFIENRFFADGDINIDAGRINLPDQFLGNLYIAGNRLLLGDNNIDLGRVDVYYPMGNSGIVQNSRLAPRNPLIDAVKGFFFNIIGRHPQLIIGENQELGNLVYRKGSWVIYDQPLDIDFRYKTIRFALPFESTGKSRISIGKMYVENGNIVLKNNEKTVKKFGTPLLRNDVAIITEQLLGYVGKNDKGFTINGLPIDQLWETRDFIKRCIGLPGDVIYVEDGKLYVNDQLLNEPYVSPENMDYSNFGPYTVPAGHFFAMGDNRSNSKDSRRIGPILKENVVGRAEYLFYPFNRAKRISSK
jgi:signal peptidase I